MSGKYDDILSLERPRSKKHPHMSRHDRAAQFSPFAALTGHSAAIEETARLTEEKWSLNEEQRAELDQIWKCLEKNIGEHPKIQITYFIPDEKKEGGLYQTLRERVKKVDSYRGTLLLMDGTSIYYENVFSIELEKDEDQ